MQLYPVRATRSLQDAESGQGPLREVQEITGQGADDFAELADGDHVVEKTPGELLEQQFVQQQILTENEYVQNQLQLNGYDSFRIVQRTRILKTGFPPRPEIFDRVLGLRRKWGDSFPCGSRLSCH